MCGINGVLNKNGGEIDKDTFIKMRDSLAHRGPDDGGVYFEKSLALGHRRLSIIDVSENGHQPFISSDNSYIIVFNGEIYNFIELRQELAKKGLKFKSNTDTEVLLLLFIEYGEACLELLNGMFAFAVWDCLKKELFIGRDRVGVKPLYYYDDNNTFLFASEIKAFFYYGIDKRLKHENISEWLLFRYVAGEETLFEGIKVLLPGHYLKISKSGGIPKVIKRWWNLSQKIIAGPPILDPVNWLKNNFYSSINYRMISDVPIGILLSGGIDSSSVAASISQNGYENIHTFNVGFENFKDDESNVAEKFSKSLNFPFHSIKLAPKDLGQLYLDATYHNDEPLIHQNDPHLIAISRFAKNQVKVLLSGEGADELMAGYVRYKPLEYIRILRNLRGLLNYMPKKLRSHRVVKLSKYLSLNAQHESVIWNASNMFPSDYIELGITAFNIENPYRLNMAIEAEKCYPNDELRQTLYLDQHTYLCSLNNRNDRTTMAASIECREPFLDYRLIEGLGKLPTSLLMRNGVGKIILKNALRKELGKDVLSFRKIGFSIPWADTIKEIPYFLDLVSNLPSHPALKLGILEHLDIQMLLNDYRRGNTKNEGLIRHLLMFVIWHDNYFLKKFE
jgi:asparagine synthase (glutamine-hydrolysing)